MKYYFCTGELLKATRRNCSIYGNPAWTLTLAYDGEVFECKTASNAACGYTIDNYKKGDCITVKGHYTRTGNFIIDYVKD